MIKAPATYNNGNLLAASLLLAMTVLALTRRPRRARQRLVIPLAALALGLTLARSAIVGVGLAAFVALVSSRRARAGMRGARCQFCVYVRGASLSSMSTTTKMSRPTSRTARRCVVPAYSVCFAD